MWVTVWSLNNPPTHSPTHTLSPSLSLSLPLTPSHSLSLPLSPSLSLSLPLTHELIRPCDHHMHMRAHTCTCVHIHAHACTYMHMRAHTCTCVRIHPCPCTRTRMHTEVTTRKSHVSYCRPGAFSSEGTFARIGAGVFMPKTDAMHAPRPAAALTEEAATSTLRRRLRTCMHAYACACIRMCIRIYTRICIRMYTYKTPCRAAPPSLALHTHTHTHMHTHLVEREQRHLLLPCDVVSRRSQGGTRGAHVAQIGLSK